MKLTLLFNGEQTPPDLLKQVTATAGANTTVSVSTAQAYINGKNKAVSIANAAGNTKRLALGFNGAQTTAAALKQVTTVAGSNTTVSVNAVHAHMDGSNEAVAIANIAGNTKKLALDFNGAQTAAVALKKVIAAAGTNTTVSVNAAQAYINGKNEAAAIADIAGNIKRLALDFDGELTAAAALKEVIAAAGTRTRVSVSTAQAYIDGNNEAVAIAFAAGDSKRLSMGFNGERTAAAALMQVIAAAGARTAISVDTAQVYTAGDNEAVSIAGAAGGKYFTMEFNGEQSMATPLKQVIAAAGVNTTIKINTAQVFLRAGNEAISIADAAGDTKRLVLEFNGAQSEALPLREVIAAAGANTAVTVNTAHAFSLNDLVSLMTAAG